MEVIEKTGSSIRERSVLMGVIKTKEQLLEELTEVQKMLVERTKIQGNMIRKLQMLITNEGLFSQLIDRFPYPIAIFTPQYKLAMINKAFEEETKSLGIHGTVRIHKHKISDIQLAAALKGVFAGKTYFINNLNNPFSIFSGIGNQSAKAADRFNRSVIFPVSNDDSKITHSVIVFMP